MATSARGERRGVRSAWAAWLVLLLPWTPIETLAQTTGGGELTEAVDAFKRRDVQRAHALAEVAFEATGEADAHELLALTSLRLGQVARASLLYSELSARDDVPAAMKRRAASQVDALRRQGTVVTIALDPPGAELRVDGYRVGVAPLRAEIVLLPGPHDLEATLTNFRPRAERLTAHPRGHLHFQWTLEPAVAAVLTVERPPPPAPAPPPSPPPSTPPPRSEPSSVVSAEPEPFSAPLPGAVSLRLVELVDGTRQLARAVERDGHLVRITLEEGAERVIEASRLAGVSIVDDDLVAAFGGRVSRARGIVESDVVPQLIRLRSGRIAAVVEDARRVADRVARDVVTGLQVEADELRDAVRLGTAAVNVVTLSDGVQVAGQFLERTAAGNLIFEQLRGGRLALEEARIATIAVVRPIERVVLHDGSVLLGKVLQNEAGRLVLSRPNGERVERSLREVAETSLSGWARGLGIEPESVRFEKRPGGFEMRVRLDASDAKRRAWMERGGLLPTYAAHVTGMGIISPASGGPCRAPNGGGGGGGGGRVGLVYLGLPDEPSVSWFGGRLTAGTDVSALSMSYGFPIEGLSAFGQPDSCSRSGYSYTQVNVPFTASLQFGLGMPDLAGSWSGLVVGLGWSPALSIGIPSRGPSTTTFVPSGFEVSFDYATLEGALEELAAEAHFRIAGFVLPPTSSNGPWVGSLTLGAVWY